MTNDNYGQVLSARHARVAVGQLLWKFWWKGRGDFNAHTEERLTITALRGVSGYPATFCEEGEDALLEDLVQVAGQSALGQDALPFLQVVFDDDGFDSQVARWAQVQRVTQHLLPVREQLEARQVLDGRKLTVFTLFFDPDSSP
ncbi:hypothetical protein INR49_028005 [Caranx melampygus]|nr:hypothetical protein INR49_028005 [Caranx melampygus]